MKMDTSSASLQAAKVPSKQPTVSASKKPTVTPSIKSSVKSTVTPSMKSTASPTATTTKSPTLMPVKTSTFQTTRIPTVLTTYKPTVTSTNKPSKSSPTLKPTAFVITGPIPFFSSSQTIVMDTTATYSNTLSSMGYSFKYTQDKLFTGGISSTPIGRNNMVVWPQGLHAQAVTTGKSYPYCHWLVVVSIKYWYFCMSILYIYPFEC